MNRIEMPLVKLSHYESRYLSFIEDYILPEEQAIYTFLPKDALKLIGSKEDRYPVVIINQDNVVGFFVIDDSGEGEKYTDNTDAILFRAFSVDRRHQGKKLAMESMRLLPSFIREHFPDKNEIILTVHHTNIPAQNLYKKCGFQDRGLRYQGSHGEEFVFHFEIDQ